MLPCKLNCIFYEPSWISVNIQSRSVKHTTKKWNDRCCKQLFGLAAILFLIISECEYGWEYDRQWYTETAPSQEDWVCDKELQVSNAFAVAKTGDVVGTFLFGQLSDQ